VDTRIEETARVSRFWRETPVPRSSRLRLAETFSAMNRPGEALRQVRKARETRPGEERSPEELLLELRLARQMGQEAEAPNLAALDGKSAPGRAVLGEWAAFLYGKERFPELRDWCERALGLAPSDPKEPDNPVVPDDRMKPDDPVLWLFLGHARWGLGACGEAGEAYDRAFSLDPGNALAACYAGQAREALGKKEEALGLYLEAGRLFLGESNYEDLALLVPALLRLGEENPEAHGLAGKWAFGIEDWERAKEELERSEALVRAAGEAGDGAVVYLLGLLLIREGRRKEALRFLEEAAARAPDYALFRFRLAENRFLLRDDPEDPALREDLSQALSLSAPCLPEGGDPSERESAGWIRLLAAQIARRARRFEEAERLFEEAARVLGEIPEIRTHRELIRPSDQNELFV